MRVMIVNYACAAHLASPETLLDEYWLLTGWAESLRDLGVEVTVVQGFRAEERRRRGEIDYRFVRGPFAPRLSRWWLPLRAHRSIASQAPDVVHLNGLLYALQARHLRRLLPPGCPLVLQHHAERPARGAAAAVQHWGLAAADGFFFTGREMALPWRRRGLLRAHQPVFEIMEGISRFSYRDRAAARADSGMHGRPVFLWAGNLIPGKDPLTVLDGFERILGELPGARLYMAYRSDEMLPQVRRRLAASPFLERTVELLGSLPYAAMEERFNSADFLLQGSVYEGSGIALADALACGVVPVVTDIPSFRFMTGNGRVGALWRPGDAGALAA
ncbi:MAG: glycosyltransferase family 4 protein, partial [Planctomycetota bacterium]